MAVAIAGLVAVRKRLMASQVSQTAGQMPPQVAGGLLSSLNTLQALSQT